MRLLLTDRFCTSAKAGGAIQADFFDESVSGLSLRVSQSGKKTWTLHFTRPSDGKRARLAIGSFPATSLASARARALEARTLIEQGVDPRSYDAGAMTVGDLVASYLVKHGSKLRTGVELRRRLLKDVVPIVGDVKLAELHRRDINRMLDPIIERGSPVAAARTFEDARALLRWAVHRGDLDHSVMEGMKRPAASKPRERVLSNDEIRHLWNVLPQALARSTQCQAILKLCLLTGARAGEVAGMRRSELDLAAREWRLPGSRTKNGNPHVIPLSTMALEIIESATGDSEYIFPRGRASLSVNNVSKTVSRANADGRFGDLESFCAHDLRRTCATGMGELGVLPHVIEAVLNHISGHRRGVAGTYNRAIYATEKRRALDMWADHLRAVIEGKPSVVPMRRRAG